MDIQKLMDGADVPQEIRDEINNLIERKKQLTEKEEISKIKILDEFMHEEFEKAEKRASGLPKSNKPDKEQADEFFRKWLFPKE